MGFRSLERSGGGKDLADAMREIANGVERMPVAPHFEMKVAAGCAPSRAHQGDLLTLLHCHPRTDQAAREMAVSGGHSASMFDFHDLAIAAAPTREADATGCSCKDRGARRTGYVDPGMEAGFSFNRIVAISKM